MGFPLHLPLSFSDLSSLSFSLTSFFLFLSLYLTLNQASMVDMWRGTYRSVTRFHHPWCGFHSWRYGFHGVEGKIFDVPK